MWSSPHLHWCWLSQISLKWLSCIFNTHFQIMSFLTANTRLYSLIFSRLNSLTNETYVKALTHMLIHLLIISPHTPNSLSHPLTRLVAYSLIFSIIHWVYYRSLLQEWTHVLIQLFILILTHIIILPLFDPFVGHFSRPTPSLIYSFGCQRWYFC